MRKTTYLTIDDGPTENTIRHVNYLKSRSIPAIMFFLGSSIERQREAAIYAVKHGIIVGNHSYSHPKFSEISFDEATLEIRRPEELIDQVYRDAGCKRMYKLFRFPYGDKGGANKGKLQEFLRSEGFMKIDPAGITHPAYYESQLDKDWDVYWTFDYAEYAIPEGVGTPGQAGILNYTNAMNLWTGGSPLDQSSAEIILLHDHSTTEMRFPGYFSELLDYTIAMGAEFKMPGFVRSSLQA
ncbi:MAG: polysaccharide deacetylase family protein [Firmicutes bacterium]|nr:polysaccharide deacetylase family protein [Bacillota bacterium]